MNLLPQLPLVLRELIEQAARPRTYLLRVTYAALLYAFVILIHAEDFLPIRGEVEEISGAGRGLFVFLTGCLFAVVYLLIPANLVTSINTERQNGTLELLCLTELGDRSLVVQKLFGRLMPMLTWLMLALPLFAVAYSKGGVSPGWVPSALYCLLLSMVQVGAFSLWISTQEADPGRSVFMVYVRMLVVFIGILGPFCFLLSFVAGLLSGMTGETMPMWMVGGFYPGIVFMGVNLQVGDGESLAVEQFFWTVVNTLPALATTLFFMRQAEAGLRSWQRVPTVDDPDQAVRRRIRNVDNGNRKVPLIAKPVAWRERSRLVSTFGTMNISLVLAVLAILMVTVTLSRHSRQGEELTATFTVWVLWGAVAIGLVMAVIGALTAERTAETESVLLTTPLSGWEILGQKLQVAWRLAGWVLLPFAWVWGCEAFKESSEVHGGVYMLLSFLHYIAFVLVLVMLATLLTTRIRQRLRAIVVTILIVAVWCMVPMWTADLVGGLINVDWQGPQNPLGYLSPLHAIDVLEHTGSWEGTQTVTRMLFVNWACYMTIGVLLFVYCRTKADRLLGRL